MSTRIRLRVLQSAWLRTIISNVTLLQGQFNGLLELKRVKENIQVQTTDIYNIHLIIMVSSQIILLQKESI